MADSDILSKIPHRILDANGDPAAGAQLETYAEGTSTPKATYSDSALSSANANPVVADAGGLLPAIYLGEGSYKFIAKDADGATLWTRDSVAGGLDSDVSAAIEATSASGFRINIGARSDINAAVDYGLATAADETARTTALNNATAAASSERRALYIPTANAYTGGNAWTFNGSISLYSELKIVGDAFALTLLDFDDCDGFVCPNADAGSSTAEILLENLHIRGTDHTGASDHEGIKFRVTRTTRGRNITIERFSDGLVYDAAQFGGGSSGNTFARWENLLIVQNDAANVSNLYPRYGVRLFSSTGSNTNQDFIINGRIYGEISIAGPTTITSGTSLTRAGHGSPVRPLYRAKGIRVFREDAAGGTYTPLTQVASGPAAGQYSLVDQDTDAIAVDDDIRSTMANDITSVDITAGDTATVSRNIRAYWVDPKGLTGLHVEDTSALQASLAIGGYETCLDVQGPANDIDLRYIQICDVGVKFGADSIDSKAYLGEQSGASVIQKVDVSGATNGRIQYLKGSRGFQRENVNATVTSASLTPAAIAMDGGNSYVPYLITEHPGPRQVRAELLVAVVGAASSFGLFTLEVSYDAGANWTVLGETREDVGFQGRIAIEGIDAFMENTDAQVAPTFRYRVMVSSSSTSTTVYVFASPTATTLSGAEATGQTALACTERGGFFTGHPLRVTLDDGTIHQSLIDSGGNAVAHPFSATTGAGDLTIATGLASDAASGNAVTGMVADSWLGIKDVNPA